MPNVSIEALDLLKKLLCKADTRLSAKQALLHPWFKLFSDTVPPLLSLTLNNLTEFHYSSKFKQAVSTFLVTQCVHSYEITDLIEVFHYLDKNGDGKLSQEEMVSYYSENYETEEALEVVQKIITSIDSDNNGFIDYFEFLAATIDQNKLLSLENLEKAFSKLDLDGNGKISAFEIKSVLEGETESKENV